MTRLGDTPLSLRRRLIIEAETRPAGLTLEQRLVLLEMLSMPHGAMARACLFRPSGP